MSKLTSALFHYQTVEERLPACQWIKVPVFDPLRRRICTVAVVACGLLEQAICALPSVSCVTNDLRQARILEYNALYRSDVFTAVGLVRTAQKRADDEVSHDSSQSGQKKTRPAGREECENQTALEGSRALKLFVSSVYHKLPSASMHLVDEIRYRTNWSAVHRLDFHSWSTSHWNATSSKHARLIALLIPISGVSPIASRLSSPLTPSQSLYQ